MGPQWSVQLDGDDQQLEVITALFDLHALSCFYCRRGHMDGSFLRVQTFKEGFFFQLAQTTIDPM